MHDAPASWSSLLHDAVTVPGKVMAGYNAFHNYSVGNQLLALWQCNARRITPGPIATYKGWSAKGRQVQKGQKAITLCMPVTIKAKTENEDDKMVFTYRPNWFVVEQTDGPAIEYPVVPGWDRETALATLKITETVFDNTDGNVQGYAVPTTQTIAINPVAEHPMKTTLHEMAHCLLHSKEAMTDDGIDLQRNIKEVEAESVALIVSDALGIVGQEYSRDYIQNWYGSGQDIPEQNARRIFTAADKILRAGRPATTEAVAEAS